MKKTLPIKLMPIEGDICRGRELGRKRNGRHRWSICSLCGKGRWLEIQRPPDMLCHVCSSRTNAMKVTKGRINAGKGYIMFKLKPDDPYFPMANKSRYILEHRYIMAKALGRFLEPWEIVHHINGIKDDNRFENFELFPRPRHGIITSAEACLKQHILRLERSLKTQGERIGDLEKQIRLLKWQLRLKQEQQPDTSNSNKRGR